MSSNKAWVTLATNDSYSLGALVLAHSLKAVNTAYKLAILITPGVSAPMKQQIEAVFDDVKLVDVLDSKDQAHLALMSRPELGVTFTKLHCWTLTNYEKCVFLDADTLVLQNCDELFEREEFSAAPDPGWPDCFNSGVFVYKPSQDTFGELLEFAKTRGSFDGGDQGLLNMFFKDWAHTDISKHLSFAYNVVWSSTYSYLPALKQFGQNMKIIHFIASSKPWLQTFNTETRLVTATSGGAGLQTLLQLWWDLFCRHVHPKLSTEMIESRLSSRYSEVPSYNNNDPIYHTPNNTPNSNNSNNYCIPTYEPPIENHYSFVDPWDEYLVASDQKSYEFKDVHIYDSQVDRSNGDGNVVEEVYLGNECKNEVANNYDIINNRDTGEEIINYQNNVIENCNKFDEEEKNIKHFEEVKEAYVEPIQEQSNDNHPACSDDIPINSNSSLSVTNCRPDSPTHYEVPKDMPTCTLDGGLAGQFARITLNETTADQKALEDFIRRQSWEQGNMDYLGKDSFSNIWAKINETLGKTTEVQIEVDVAKTTSAPEVVHTEEPKPLKSALKKTSTTTPPLESELVGSSEPPTKQLEKLDLSKNDLKQPVAPETPVVTSPTPPTTPASQVQESRQPESIESANETPKDNVCTKVSLESSIPESTETAKETAKDDVCTKVSLETASAEPIEPTQETPENDVREKASLDSPKPEPTKPELVEPKEEGATAVAGTVAVTAAAVATAVAGTVAVTAAAVATEAESPKPEVVAEEPTEGGSVRQSDTTVPKVDKPAQEVSQPTEIAQQPRSAVDSSTRLVPNDPPVAPKRANKGSSNVPKNEKPSGGK